jgi:hypothetical protein
MIHLLAFGNKTILIIFILIINFSKAQDYSFSKDIISNKVDKLVELSLIGLHKDVVSFATDRYHTKPIVSYSNSYSVQTLSADSFVYFQAKENQVLVFNENHHDVSTRILLAKFLDSLYLLGYRDLALETANQQHKINENQYVSINDGHFLKESNFGYLVRKAQSLGIRVHAYEFPIVFNKTIIDEKGNITQLDTVHNFYQRIIVDSLGEPIEFFTNCTFVRDSMQGIELAKIYKKVSNKLIVYLGAGHINENFNHTAISVFKRHSQINPISFNLIDLVECSENVFEDSIYRFINPKEVCLIKLEEEFYTLNKGTDYTIALPRTNYFENRPDFLVSLGRKRVVIPKRFYKHFSFPILCIAKNNNEPKDASPYDVIEIAHKAEMKSLYLPSGKFEIEVKDYSKSQRFILKVN